MSVAVGLAAVVLVACGSESGYSGGKTPSSESPVATDTAGPPATATALPLGSLEPDGERALDHVEKLSVEIGTRVAGTEEEKRARDYIRQTLESYGYAVSVQEFTFDASAFQPARIDTGGQPIAAFGFGGAATGEVNGPLVRAGIGRPEDFPPEARGAIVLIERGDLTFAAKAANASAAGAVGVIIYNNEDGAFLGSMDPPSPIPAAAIAREEGQQLAARLETEPITATISVSSAQGTAYNVIAKPRGIGTCETVSGGHHDSVPVAPGADDNASGTAAVLELARVMAASGTPGANCFALFGAEEFGLFGSRAYVEAMTDAEQAAITAMLNLDVVGVAGRLQLIGGDDLVSVARIEARKIGIDASPSGLPAGVGSDHMSFDQAGVPVLMFTRPDGRIHTADDGIQHILPQSLEEVVRVAAATLAQVGGP